MDSPRKVSDLFALPVLDHYLIYAPRADRAMLVNRQACERLYALVAGQAPTPADPPELLLLKRQIRKGQRDIPRERSGDVEPLFLGLVTTRACNLACVYCDFDSRIAGSNRLGMNRLTAAIDWMAETAQRNGRSGFDVHFFGGEPFITPDIIEVAVHRARHQAATRGLNVRFEAATNGVFDDGVLRFVLDYFDTLVLSLDGPREIHDRNRPGPSERGSFTHVLRTARELDRSQVELCLRTCVTNESVQRMEEIVDWFSTEFSPAMISFETLTPTAESEQAGLRPPDPYDFAVNFLRARRLLHARGLDAVYAAASVDETRNSFCPLGGDALILSPDGRISGCYLPQRAWEEHGLDLDLGTVDTQGRIHLDLSRIERLRSPTWGKARCSNCFCRLTCAGGCHVNHTYPGCDDRYDDICIQTRLITATNLLLELDLGETADALAASAEGMKRLAHRASDRIEDFPCGV